MDYELLCGYKKIIFSNWELNDRLFDAYENNNFNYQKYIDSKFNKVKNNNNNGQKLQCTKEIHFGLLGERKE